MSSVYRISREYHNRPLTLAILPSFDLDAKNSEALLSVSNWLKELHTDEVPLVGIIYLQSIRDKDVPRTAAKTLHILKKICGTPVFGDILMTTTMWSQVTQVDGLSRETVFCQRDDLWIPFITNGSQLCRFAETRDGADELIQKLIRRPPVVLQLQHEVIVQRKSTKDTKAGSTILKYLKIARQHMKDREAKRHLLNPQAHFSHLQSLETEVAKGCGIRSLFLRHLSGISLKPEMSMFAAVRPLDNSSDSSVVSPPDSGQDISMAVRLQVTMEGVLTSFRMLQEQNFCGDNFSIIVASQDLPKTVEVVPISITVLMHMVRLINEVTMLANSGKGNKVTDRVKALELAADRTLSYLGFQGRRARPYKFEKTAQLVLMLALGLVSYAGSHAADFHSTCFGLSDPCAFDVAYFEDSCPRITLQQERLACLDKFVGGSVWVFKRTTGEPFNKEPLFLSTSLEDLTDLWGPAWIAECDDSPDQVHHVTVERGVIYQPLIRDETLTPQHDGVVCHWRAWDEIDATSWDAKPFTRHDQMVIGGEKDFYVNPTCPLKDGLLNQNFAQKNVEFTLGTDGQRHQLDMQTLSLQFSKVVTIGYQASFKRMPGRTWKDMLLLEWSDERPSPSTLDVLLGLEISACTGNGRRVKLWELFNLPGIQQFIKVTMPDELPASNSPFPSFLDSFSSGFGRFERRWVASSDFRRAARQIIRKVLQHLSYTGIDKDDCLRAWWADSKALQGFKINPKQHRWVRMLHDTERTAVFAAISDLCLEFLGSRRYGSMCSSRDTIKGSTALCTMIILDSGFVKMETQPATPVKKPLSSASRAFPEFEIRDAKEQSPNTRTPHKSARRRLASLEDELSHVNVDKEDTQSNKIHKSHGNRKLSDHESRASTGKGSSNTKTKSTSHAHRNPIDSIPYTHKERRSREGSSDIYPSTHHRRVRRDRKGSAPSLETHTRRSNDFTSIKTQKSSDTETSNQSLKHNHPCDRCGDIFVNHDLLRFHLHSYCEESQKVNSSVIPMKSFMRDRRRVLAEGQKIRLLDNDELLIRDERFPQLVEWRAKGALRSIDGFIDFVARMKAPVHRELISEDIENDCVFHVAVM